ncbi:MAG: SPOR domain-containing protein, partial [Bacteroidota bacterium]
GTVDREDASQEYSRINVALIHLAEKVGSLEQGKVSTPKPSSNNTVLTNTSSNKNNTILLSVLLGVLLISIVSYFIFSSTEPTVTESQPEPVEQTPEYIICVDAYKQKSQAQNKVAELARQYTAYNGKVGFIWIPDYDCLRGVELYQVYIGPFTDKTALNQELCDYKQRFKKSTYAVKLCTDGNREEVRCKS